MSHVLSRGRFMQPPTFLQGAVQGFKAYTHLLKLLRQYHRADECSATAVVQNGNRLEVVSFANGFELNGTTFMINTNAGGVRRIPALQIKAIEDKTDSGY